MFRGDHPEVTRALDRAVAVARELGHPRTGSDNRLLRAGRLVGLRSRHADLVRRSQRTTGRTAT